MSDKPSDGAVAEIYYDYELRVWRQRHTGGRGHSGDYVNEIIAMEYIESLVERLAETEAKLREAEERERKSRKAIAIARKYIAEHGHQVFRRKALREIAALTRK